MRFQCTLHGYCPCGLPHSEICGSMDICSSPQLIAACHVLHRLLMPRHSPCALSSLTFSTLRPLPFRFTFRLHVRSASFAPSCQRILVLFENYAGFRDFYEIVTPPSPQGRFSTICSCPLPRFALLKSDSAFRLSPFCRPRFELLRFRFQVPLCCLTCLFSLFSFQGTRSSFV